MDEFEIVDEYVEIGSNHTDSMNIIETTDNIFITDLNALKSELSTCLRDMRSERAALTRERESVQRLEQDFAEKIRSYDIIAAQNASVMQSLNAKDTQLDELRMVLHQEIESVQKTRIGLETEQGQIQTERQKLLEQSEMFRKDRQRLNELIAEISVIGEHSNRSRSLTEHLTRMVRQTTETEKELERLREIRLNQQRILNEAKVETEEIRSLQKPALRILDETAYACKQCSTHVALEANVESKCYQVGQGHFTEKKRGFLFTDAVNLELGPTKTETFTTGSYDISWVSCMKCSHQMGWKYLNSDTGGNNAKVGKFCLARYSLISPEERAESQS